MLRLLNRLQDLLDASRALDFLAPLAIRLYLAPVFWMAGTKKLANMDNTIAWFGNSEWGLGLPYPEVMAWAAALTEAGGAVLLVLGLAARWISIPLMVTMVVAAVTVHWEHGWAAIAETPEATEKLERAIAILQQYGNYEWLTSSGEFVILNNGIEFAATYFIMLLVLFFYGAGRYLSLDYWIARRFRHSAR
ncbi:MAG: DoxX family protein [Gammaproteobacteria bacterium]|nr:MAG: DoxX family protein [Gammaproteobacteria bacterium]